MQTSKNVIKTKYKINAKNNKKKGTNILHMVTTNFGYDQLTKKQIIQKKKNTRFKIKNKMHDQNNKKY